MVDEIVVPKCPALNPVENVWQYGSVMMVTVARYDQACRHVPADAWAAGSTAAAISARCRFIASVLQAGRIRAAPLPHFGQNDP
jgi:hypothetical protein